MTDETVQPEVVQPTQEEAVEVVEATQPESKSFAETVREALESLETAPSAFVHWIKAELEKHL